MERRLVLCLVALIALASLPHLHARKLLAPGLDIQFPGGSVTRDASGVRVDYPGGTVVTDKSGCEKGQTAVLVTYPTGGTAVECKDPESGK